MAGSSLEGGRIGRRELMKWVGAAAAASGMVRSIGVVPRARAATGPIKLDMTAWSYSVETILDNIRRFEEAYQKRILVQLTEIPWTAYHETMVARLTGRTSTDVMYNGGDWLPEFASAGWVVPLEDYFPKVRSYYSSKIVPYALQDMTFKGKIYGLPYYADIISFMYNAQILKEKGIPRPPQTWEELADQAAFLKGKGIEQPIVLEFAAILPTTLEHFSAMVFSRGGELFDENYNPIFDKPGTPGWETLKWLAEMQRKGLQVLLPHETEVVKALNTGRHVFTVLYNYNLAELNNKAASPLAGQFQLGMMPGQTHETYGFCKFYNMTKMAVDRGKDVVDAVLKFIEYFGGEYEGKYVVAKRWAVEKGLGFGQLPLYDDPDVRRSFSQWVDMDMLKAQSMKARARRQAVPWYGPWGEFARMQLLRAVTGEASVEDAIGAMASQAKDLKQQFGG